MSYLSDDDLSSKAVNVVLCVVTNILSGTESVVAVTGGLSFDNQNTDLNHICFLEFQVVSGTVSLPDS